MEMKRFVSLALEEDLAELGDITSRAIFSDEIDSFSLVAKEGGILCGSGVFTEVFAQIDPAVSVGFFVSDGHVLSPGQTAAVVRGKVISVLTAERTAINFLSLLSGISTSAGRFVSRAGNRTVILDTRKTIPGFRELAKYAVVCGGAQNHRRGLYDMVMIKDNHIDAAGGITSAVQRVRSAWGNQFAVEVEVRTLEEVKEALSCKVDRIMLDNMSCQLMKDAVKLIGESAEIEASGNMTLDRIEEVSRTGVDFISVGEITHTVRSLDFSLKRS